MISVVNVIIHRSHFFYEFTIPILFYIKNRRKIRIICIYTLLIFEFQIFCIHLELNYCSKVKVTCEKLFLLHLVMKVLISCTENPIFFIELLDDLGPTKFFFVKNNVFIDRKNVIFYKKKIPSVRRSTI
jgi:hypothetical protein